VAFAETARSRRSGGRVESVYRPLPLQLCWLTTALGAFEVRAASAVDVMTRAGQHE
jgi:hypothetical protein